ncbi:MAG: hypothetical protein K0V04_15480 [Deltaproteobacteria bacterium]|nr:hypothetical protein [Deltaproteobacteria bacterium]
MTHAWRLVSAAVGLACSVTVGCSEGDGHEQRPVDSAGRRGAPSVASEPQQPPQPAASPLAGADPSTIESKTVLIDGKATKVTTFQSASPKEGELEALTKACNDGTRGSCVQLGMQQQRLGDNAAAEATWAKACDQGEGASCHELGNMLTNPFLKLGRETEGIGFLERGCTLEHTNSCYFLAQIIDKGQHGAKPDPARARQLYTKGCADGRGNNWSCTKVSVGSVPSGGDCKWDACADGLWCMQDRCTTPPI